MNSILDSNNVLAAIQQRKRTIRKRLEGSRTQIMDTAQGLTGSVPRASGRAQNISRLIINGLVLYRGFRLCSGVVTGIHSLFTSRKRRR